MGNFLFLTRWPFRIRPGCKKQDVSRSDGIPSSGFTLLEMMVVVAIIGILASIGIPSFSSVREKAKTTMAIAEVGILDKEILLWEMDHGSLPLSLEDIGRGNLLDPWGNPYQYLNFATVNGLGKQRKDHMQVPINDFFDLYSMGKDGKSQSSLQAAASRDDIIRANNGQYIGLASEY